MFLLTKVDYIFLDLFLAKFFFITARLYFYKLFLIMFYFNNKI